jgi:predicted DsbA family dithiol-disulfide isomerase
MDELLRNPSPTAPRPLAFSVLRIPFFLEPGYDETQPFIETNRERLIRKWGGPEEWKVQKQRHDLKGRGLEAGIPHFNLDRLAANTMASHRLIQHLGKTYGLAISEAIYDLLNQYYFVDGHSLNDKPRLAMVVSELLQELLPVGDAPPTDMELLDFLNGDQGREQIMHALHALNQLGIHSIPKFIIEGRTVVDGAARSDTFVKIFREIEARGTDQGTAIFNDVLGVSNETLERGSHLPPSSVTVV